MISSKREFEIAMTQDNLDPASTSFTQAKHRLASHPETAPEVLEKLAEKESKELLERVAENIHTPPSTLEKLAAHEAPEVRSAVTDNANTPDASLEALSKDEHPDVRFRVAENPNTPGNILETLREDDNPYIGARAKTTLIAVEGIAKRADQAFLDGHFAEAEALYRRLVTDLRTLLGQENLEVASAMHKLAAVLVSQNKPKDAKLWEERAKLIIAAHNEL